MSFIGRVKWFNNKAGYGFVTITDGERSGEDIFVHHSGITVDAEQFKYLLQGEYVEFHISATPEGSKHASQATNVTGVKGGKLMCQTRNEARKEKVVPTTSASTATTSASTKVSASARKEKKGKKPSTTSK